MAKQFAFLDYTFIFDTSTWSHVSQFDADLADFFSAYNLEAQKLNSISGQPGKRVFLIRPIEPLIAPIQPNKPSKPVQQILKEMRGDAKGK
jgi:hypothetical protein